MEKKTVLVTGIGGNVGQGVLRNIQDLNWNIRLVGTNIEEFCAGNHLCDVTYRVPYAYEDDYITCIQKIVEREKVDLIIPTTDYEVFFLASNKKNITTVIAVSDKEVAENYLDKYLTFKLHLQKEIPFVISWLPSEFKDYEGEIIAKPRKGRGSRGIEINPKEPQLFSDDYLIQPLYRGKEITTAFYVKKDGTLHGIFTMERELSNGATSKSKTTSEFDEMIKNEIILKMIQIHGLRGSINLQSIVDEKGMIHPFEVNCRISGTNSIRHNLGFQDVKYTLQEYLYNEDPSKIEAQDGIAVRLLYDVIYPGATNEESLNNNSCNFKLY